MTKIGMVTDSLGHLSFFQMLDTAAVMGISGVEANACNWTSAPHFQIATMLKDPSARKTLQVDVKAHNLDLIALNANGNKLHPTEGKKQSEDLYNTIRLAGKFGVKTVVLIHYRPKAELDGPCRTREDYQLILKSEQDTA